MMSKGYIYMDNNATTPLDKKVLEAMMPFLTDQFANPSSTHKFGKSINRELNKAKEAIATLINCDVHEVIFTSGATESINLAIKGLTYNKNPRDHHLITLATEHKAVLDVYNYLQSIGFEVTYLPVESDGRLDIGQLKNALKENTSLVSVMYANNETGVIQDIQGIAEVTHEAGALFFTDATQAFGKIRIDVNNIDLMSFSGHKIYGPKGIGGLYIDTALQKKLNPVIHGGGHQNNLRSGTLNAPGIIGLGKAAEIANEQQSEDFKHTSCLRNRVEKKLLNIPGTKVNGSIEFRMPTTTNIQFKGVNTDVLMNTLGSVIISNGSACTSATIEPSHVLKSMGLSEDEAFGSVRISVGRFNTRNEIEIAIKEITDRVESLSQLVTN